MSKPDHASDSQPPLPGLVFQVLVIVAAIVGYAENKGSLYEPGFAVLISFILVTSLPIAGHAELPLLSVNAAPADTLVFVLEVSVPL